METQNITTIHTGLPGFVLLNAITHVDSEGIAGTCRLSGATPYLGIECLAQLGAWHVRFLTDFARHTLVLKITRCTLPREEVLSGNYLLEGRLTSRSTAAFSYDLAARLKGKVEIAGHFLYAAVNYDDRFQRELIQEHYRRIFSCLKSATRND